MATGEWGDGKPIGGSTGNSGGDLCSGGRIDDGGRDELIFKTEIVPGDVIQELASKPWQGARNVRSYSCGPSFRRRCQDAHAVCS